MRVEAYKSRFAKLGTKIEVEVPYEKGMDPLSGILEMLVEANLVSQGGAWFTFTPKDGSDPVKFQRKTFTKELFDRIIDSTDILKQEEQNVLADVEA